MKIVSLSVSGWVKKVNSIAQFSSMNNGKSEALPSQKLIFESRILDIFD